MSEGRDRLSLRVLSYNIEGHAVARRREHIFEISKTIAALRPDIAGLQEVHRNTTNGGGVDHPAEIVAGTGLDAAFGPSLEAWGGQYGNALLTRGEFVSSEVELLPGRGEQRSVLRSVVRIDGHEITVFVTHLEWGWQGRGSRRLQLNALLPIVQSSSRGPTILMGDFNARPNAAEMAKVLRCEFLRECSDPGSATFPRRSSHLDYIFASPHFETVSTEVIPTGPSDHWPVLAELRLVTLNAENTTGTASGVVVEEGAGAG